MLYNSGAGLPRRYVPPGPWHDGVCLHASSTSAHIAAICGAATLVPPYEPLPEYPKRVFTKVETPVSPSPSSDASGCWRKLPLMFAPTCQLGFGTNFEIPPPEPLLPALVW